MFTYPIGLLNPNVGSAAILITMDMSTPSTAGINLTFASGSLNIDWKEGGGIVPFVSGVELTYTYITPGTYIAEITGDLINITKLRADNSKITFIENLVTGLLTEFRINSNLYVGDLNMSQAPISEKLQIYANLGLTDVVFADSGNGILTIIDINATGITVFDLTNVRVSTSINAPNCPNLTNIIPAVSGNGLVTNLIASSCDLTGTLDLSNLPTGGTFFVLVNSNLTNVVFASSGNGVMLNFRMRSTALGVIIFSNMSFAVNNGNVQLHNNNASAAEVNENLVNLYNIVSGEGVGGDFTGRTIRIDGTNAAPDGSSGGFDGDQAVIDLTAKGIAVTTS